jgi:hypothetical protein
MEKLLLMIAAIEALKGQALDLKVELENMPQTPGGFTQEQVDALIAAEIAKANEAFLLEKGQLEAKVVELQSAVDSIPAQIKAAKIELWEKVKAVKADDEVLKAEIDAELA